MHPATFSELDQMLQPLLEDRFGLKWHYDKKEVPVYYLTVTKGGPKLRPTPPGSCIAYDPDVPPPPPKPGVKPACGGLLMPWTQDLTGAALEGKSISISPLLTTLEHLVGRPVIDKTGIVGTFDIQLKFASDGLAVRFQGEPQVQATEPSGLPNIFTAIRQLGLRLEPGKGLIDIFVVDSIRKPSEN